MADEDRSRSTVKYLTFLGGRDAGHRSATSLFRGARSSLRAIPVLRSSTGAAAPARCDQRVRRENRQRRQRRSRARRSSTVYAPGGRVADTEELRATSSPIRAIVLHDNTRRLPACARSCSAAATLLLVLPLARAAARRWSRYASYAGAGGALPHTLTSSRRRRRRLHRRPVHQRRRDRRHSRSSTRHSARCRRGGLVMHFVPESRMVERRPG